MPRRRRRELPSGRRPVYRIDSAKQLDHRLAYRRIAGRAEDRISGTLRFASSANTISLMNAARVLWALLATALLAFAVFESVKYGWVAGGVVIAFAVMPDLALIGAFAEHGRLRPARVRAYNLLHTPWIPLALIAASIVLPLPSLGWGLRGGLELFLAGLAWLLHIALDRAFGYGLRASDGSIRPVGRRRAHA